MDRYTTWIIAGSFFAALAVIFGAFGAHGLKSKVSPEDLIIFGPLDFKLFALSAISGEFVTTIPPSPQVIVLFAKKSLIKIYSISTTD